MHRESRRRIGGGKDVRGGKDVAVRRVEHHSQDVSKAPALPGLFRFGTWLRSDDRRVSARCSRPEGPVRHLVSLYG